MIRLYALKRKLIWRLLADKYDVYLVAEYPKSGGTWYSQMLADYLELPFPRNTTKPVLEKCVMHGHELYKGYRDRVSVVLRDGRDLMVSFYYHHLFFNEWNHHPSVQRHRDYLGFRDFEDIRENLPDFIEYMNTVWARKFNHFSWSDFVFSWLKNVPAGQVIRYEDLLSTPVAAMTLVINALGVVHIDRVKLEKIVDKYSFEKVAGRKTGIENKASFVRKGISGDWINHFTKEAREVFDQYSGEALIYSGYEKDRSWVVG